MTFFVLGSARPQGSKRPMRHASTGKVVLIESSNVKPWRQDIRQAALEHGATPLHVPVDLAGEKALPVDLKSWLAFARQKIATLTGMPIETIKLDIKMGV